MVDLTHSSFSRVLPQDPYWVEESDYSSSLADYNAKIAQQELAQQEAATYNANDGR